jgi:pyrroline-5-carboxylate reductase
MDKKIGIIGYGSMGKMISSQFIESKYYLNPIFLSQTEHMKR